MGLEPTTDAWKAPMLPLHQWHDFTRLSATLVRWLSPRAVLSPYRLGMRIIHPRVCCATANMGMERIELSIQALKVLCHTTWLHPHIMRRFAPALG